MALEGLAFLRDLVVDFIIMSKPTWPQNGVIQIRCFDYGGGIPLCVQDTAIPFAGHLPIDAH